MVIECPLCKSVLPDDRTQCYRCGTRLLKKEEKTPVVVVEKGCSYLIKEKRFDSTMKIFKYLTSHGFKGCCVTSTFPPRIIKQYLLPPIRTMWLSTVENQKNAYNPSRLDFEITSELAEFIKTTVNPVVVIEGFQSLVISNSVTKVIEFLEYITDLISVNNGILLLPINPMAYREDELALIEGCIDILEVPDSEKFEIKIGPVAPPAKAEPEISAVKDKIISPQQQRPSPKKEGLVICPSCKTEISMVAEMCYICGYRVRPRSHLPQQQFTADRPFIVQPIPTTQIKMTETKTVEKKSKLFMVCGVISILVGIWLFVGGFVGAFLPATWTPDWLPKIGATVCFAIGIIGIVLIILGGMLVKRFLEG